MKGGISYEAINPKKYVCAITHSFAGLLCFRERKHLPLHIFAHVWRINHAREALMTRGHFEAISPTFQSHWLSHNLRVRVLVELPLLSSRVKINHIVARQNVPFFQKMYSRPQKYL